MGKTNVAGKLSKIDQHWSPRIVAELNGQHVKMAKEETHAVLFEPAQTRNTGNRQCSRENGEGPDPPRTKPQPGDDEGHCEM